MSHTATETSTSAPPTTLSTSLPPSSSTVLPQQETVPAGTIPRGPVTALLNYYSPPLDGSKPHQYVSQPPPDTPVRNFGDSTHPTLINDIRGHEHSRTLDIDAFEALTSNKVPGGPLDTANAGIKWDDEASVREKYYPHIIELLKKRLDPKGDVLIFDHTVRLSRPGADRAPVNRTHIDQSSASAIARVKHHLSAEKAQEILDKGTRVRLINVWAPLNGAVETHPLAFASSRSVKNEDLVGVEHRYPDRTGETVGVNFKKEQEWFYWSGIDSTERILLECFDSEKGAEGQERRVAHSAFEDPRNSEGAKGRESVEVRCLIFG